MKKQSLESLTVDEVMALSEEEALKLMDQILRAAKKAGIPVPSVRSILWPNALVKFMILHYKNSFSEKSFRLFEEVLQIDAENFDDDLRFVEALEESVPQNGLLSRRASNMELRNLVKGFNRSDLVRLAKSLEIDCDLKISDLVVRLLAINEEVLSRAFKRNFPEKFVDPTSLDECFILGDLETLVSNLPNIDRKRVFTEFFAEFKILVDHDARGLPHLFLFEDAIDFEEGKRVIKKVLGQMTKA